MTAKPPRRRLIAMAVFTALLALIGVVAFALLRETPQKPPVIEHRADPIADLLAWIPASPEASDAFSAWTADPGVQTMAIVDLQQIDTLAIEPVPRTLGRTGAWSSTFGWNAINVTGWATAGDGRGLTVLAGVFDVTKIERALKKAGYVAQTYRGVEIWQLQAFATPGASTAGDAEWAANAIALLDGRLIVAPEAGQVRAAIDVAAAGSGSLADEPGISTSIATLAPLSGLVGIGQADFAAQCDPARGQAAERTGEHVFVGYGRVGTGGERRTLIATSYADEVLAAANEAAYQNGWIAGFANAGGTGGSLAAFGSIAHVGRAGRLLVAEIVNGRDDGWVRSGIRFALPVCEAVLAFAPPQAPPDPEAGLTLMERVAAALPETGTEGLYRAANLRELAGSRGGSVPSAEEPASSDAGGWLAMLAPLPAFTIMPSNPANLAVWSTAYNIPLSTIIAIGETRVRSDRESVGVLIGDWNPDEVDFALRSLGYSSIRIGVVRHFSIDTDDAANTAAFRAAGLAWENVALLGDRLWISADQGALRDVVDVAVGDAAPETSLPPVRQSVLLAAPDALATEVVGVDYQAARCSAVIAGVLAAGAFWSSGEVDTARIVLLTTATGSTTDYTAYLDQWGRAYAVGSSVSTASPVAGPIGLTYVGIESQSLAGTPAAISTFTLPAGSPRPAEFFAGSTGSCDLVEAA